MSLTAWLLLVLAFLATVIGLACVRRRSQPCRTCDGLGLIRGARGRFARVCGRCRGSGQRDTWSTRALVVLTGGRVLPPAGSAATGWLPGQAPALDGRHPGGAVRFRADPPDTRLVALDERRVPALERRVERREADLAATGGPLWLIERARLGAARRALRRAREAAERHREALEANAAGYRAARRRS